MFERPSLLSGRNAKVEGAAQYLRCTATLGPLRCGGAAMRLPAGGGSLAVPFEK